MSAKENEVADQNVSHGRRRTTLAHTLVALICIVCGWMAIDQISKRLLDSLYESGQVVAEPIPGVFQIHLIHNSGMAWGMLNGSSLFLGIFSLAICALLVIYLFRFSDYRTPLEIIGVSLVVAGGLGNAVDRFVFGAVVDFIQPTFIDFPVFNIADIGVTCGVVIFIIGLILAFPRSGKKTTEQAAEESENNTQEANVRENYGSQSSAQGNSQGEK